MNKLSITAQQTLSSVPNYFQVEETQLRRITEQQLPKQRSQLNTSSLIEPKRQRKLSFMQLESDQQIIMEKMIRRDMKNNSKLLEKMSLDEDETSLFVSDIYKKSESMWKNRQTSQLTTKKLCDIDITKISKIKLLNQHPMTGYNLLRVTCGEKDIRDFAIGVFDSTSWFSNAIWVMLVCKGHELVMKKSVDTQIEGLILKKSQFLKKWELRYVSISAKNGLISSRKKGQTPSVKIKETSQLWSRCEVINHQGIQYVVLKIWNMMFKCEVAVPIEDSLKWVRALASLVK